MNRNRIIFGDCCYLAKNQLAIKHPATAPWEKKPYVAYLAGLGGSHIFKRQFLQRHEEGGITRWELPQGGVIELGWIATDATSVLPATIYLLALGNGEFVEITSGQAVRELTREKK